jgi:hypothetical protein
LVLFGADAIFPHIRTGNRHDAQKIFSFTVHTPKTLCEPATGQACQTHGISRAGDSIAKMESVPSICPIASAKQANPHSLNPQWTGIRTGATYRFWTRHALLLVKTRFSRPRNSRGETALWPAKWPRRCPQPRAVRVRSGAVSSPQPGGVRVQSVTASAPITCPWAVRGCHRAKVGTVRELSAACPQSREAVRVNQRRDDMSPVVASIYCSPHPAALQIDPPPGSGILPL